VAVSVAAEGLEAAQPQAVELPPAEVEAVIVSIPAAEIASSPVEPEASVAAPVVVEEVPAPLVVEEILAPVAAAVDLVPEPELSVPAAEPVVEPPATIQASTPAEPAPDLDQVLAESGLVLVQTTGTVAAMPAEAPPKLGRPRKQTATTATADEPLLMVETQK
jgi:ribonuclease E